MNIEQARLFALSLPETTEDLFDEQIVSFRICGKWFMLMHLWSVEARVAVKLNPDRGIEMRDQYDAVRPAWHMNKRHWNDLFLESLPIDVAQSLIRESFCEVVSKLPRADRERIMAELPNEDKKAQ